MLRPIPASCLIAPRTLMAVALAALVLCSDARAQDAPAPEPDQAGEVPKHAAGVWAQPSEDRRTPEQRAAVHAVATELRRIANAHGPDSVVLQSKFMIRSMTAGAAGPTEVRVAGPSTGDAGPGHLEIDVETGLIFDESTTTAESRRETVWKDVALPVLDEMASFKIEPEALELVFLFDVQKIVPGEPVVLAEDAHHEAFRVLMARDVLEDLVADRVVGDAMREKVILTPAVTVARPAPAASR
jgi:hypothetical protein